MVYCVGLYDKKWLQCALYRSDDDLLNFSVSMWYSFLQLLLSNFFWGIGASKRGIFCCKSYFLAQLAYICWGDALLSIPVFSIFSLVIIHFNRFLGNKYGIVSVESRHSAKFCSGRIDFTTRYISKRLFYTGFIVLLSISIIITTYSWVLSCDFRCERQSGLFVSLWKFLCPGLIVCIYSSIASQIILKIYFLSLTPFPWKLKWMKKPSALFCTSWKA